jgi:tRNA-Thr(GGU) m(6)t(6)A37 methyltransferase TsaA
VEISEVPVRLVVRPIGFIRSPFAEKAEAPRQATLGKDTRGTVEILPEYRDALCDLEGFDRIWLLFWFDRAEGWRPKVQPPRSATKRGVFATRSPHRPNAIGMSAVRLERVDGLVLHVKDLDLVDRTPILDIKPYIPYADAFPDAREGWLDAPEEADAWRVVFEPVAEEEALWIEAETDRPLKSRIETALGLGPRPHAYRRIKETEAGLVLAVKEWRVVFRADEGPPKRILVERIMSGYRPRELAHGTEPVHDLHRAFVTRFGGRIAP